MRPVRIKGSAGPEGRRRRGGVGESGGGTALRAAAAVVGGWHNLGQRTKGSGRCCGSSERESPSQDVATPPQPPKPPSPSEFEK